MNDLSLFAELVPIDHGLCVVSTLRPDGSIQSSVVNAGVLEHPTSGEQVKGDQLRLLLLQIFTAAGGTHDDWDTYDRVMADERRTAVLITPLRTYTNPS